MSEYTQSQELADMAEKLIADHYADITELELRIAYFFVDKMARKAGTCRGLGTQERMLSGKDFVITINKEVWDKAGGITNGEVYRTAILDHELEHVSVALDDDTGEPKRTNGEGDNSLIKIGLKHHDLEEFAGIVQRYGAYAADVRNFVNAFESGRAAENIKARVAEVEGARTLTSGTGNTLTPA